MWCVARFGTFVQFKKPENYPWRSVPFVKPKGVPFIKLKETLLH